MSNEYKLSEIFDLVNKSADHKINLWGAAAYLTRNIRPQCFTIVGKYDPELKTIKTIRILDASGKVVDYYGSANGCEIMFFDSEQKALGYYHRS